LERSGVRELKHKQDDAYQQQRQQLRQTVPHANIPGPSQDAAPAAEGQLKI
jgi:hypothetical protein